MTIVNHFRIQSLGVRVPPTTLVEGLQSLQDELSKLRNVKVRMISRMKLLSNNNLLKNGLMNITPRFKWLRGKGIPPLSSWWCKLNLGKKWLDKVKRSMFRSMGSLDSLIPLRLERVLFVIHWGWKIFFWVKHGSPLTTFSLFSFS